MKVNFSIKRPPSYVTLNGLWGHTIFYIFLYFCVFSICARKKSLNHGITDSQSLGVPEFFCET